MMNESIPALLTFIYGRETTQAILPRLAALLDHFRSQIQTHEGNNHFDHRDAILITYGDMVRYDDEPPLQTLRRFLQSHVGGLVRGVHLLPFFPYSSDDGFSVVDYYRVDPALGTWDDVEAFAPHFRLMFDAVINHISQHSAWFQAFKKGQPPYDQFFLTVESDGDLSTVFRPRALPLLTPVETVAGTKQVWTTFSDDQIDLNYRSPELLLEVLRVLLTYVVHGAELLRLDAIAFIWKEPGTSCIHRPQTHALIRLMRAVLDEVAPHVALVTETNVPHEENVSYFGDGYNEAQMVYNFSLPPLTLHAFHTGSAATLSRWAATLHTPSDRTTFFNFLASHDGIGLTPARGLLGDTEIQAMAERTQALGGHVSYRNTAGGQMPYELNINYLDALGDPDQPRLDVALVARRFLSAQAIMLSLRGVPGIYFHSLFGSRNWPQGVQETGHYRTINRQKLTRSTLEQELSDSQSLRSHVFRGYSQLLRARTGHPAFHPSGSQQVLPVHDAIFALHRTSPDAQHHLLCLHNVSPNHHSLSLALPADFPAATHLRDLLTGETYPVRQRQLEVTVPAYGVLWVTVDGRRRTADRTQLARNIHRHNSISSMVAPATREGE